MSQEINHLEPTALWKNFINLNQIPRASKNEEKAIAFVMNFGRQLGLETEKDNTGNVIIRKPATIGLEDRKAVILQAHLDMVHQKNNDTTFNFDQQGIQMFIDDDWVRAHGTTLGADNGIGVAAMLAVLAADDIAHPKLEALFTVDEETGMTGATGLDKDKLQGEILLNLDTEDDEEICIGSAGGLDISTTKTYREVAVVPNTEIYHLSVKGLRGGHSGMDIHRGLANANKIMNRILYELNRQAEIQIINIQGGSLRNAIPRESVATIAITSSDENTVNDLVENISASLRHEFQTTEPSLQILAEKLPYRETKAMNADDQKQLLNALYAAPNGVYAMSADFDNLVLSSNNLAIVSVTNGTIDIQSLTRSSLDSSKTDLANTLRAAFELMGAKVEFSGSYPGWQPNPDSEILSVLAQIYKEQNNREANIMAVHAGLECGILGEKYPHLDKISFGPTILGAHSPDERVSIKSVQKFWAFLIEILKNIPLKQDQAEQKEQAASK